MTDVNFRFSTRILARLGEELNQGADQSILELVKNSYDADAKNCVIEIEQAAKEGGTIKISDDGVGMTASVIRDNWLVLGSSSKSSGALTKLGRTPAGSKGLGRLAALRMGKEVLLESRPCDEKKTNHLEIDWDDFTANKTVEDVTLRVFTKRRPSETEQGTYIELKKLNKAIRADELKRLARSILLLTDPFGDTDAGFKVTLKAEEYKEIEKLIKQKYFDDADFHLQASINASGHASLKLLDWRGSVLASESHEEIRKDKGNPYRCPPVTFNFWAFLLKTGDFLSGRKSTIGEIREWLKTFGGVHVYQDKIRVTPYGNPSDDWLQINLARAKSPEERPSTNNSIGRVIIQNRGPHQLTQKTDRSGYIEDAPFEELRSFCQDALEWMARWRLDQAEKRRAKERRTSSSEAAAQRKTMEEVIAQAPKALQKSFESAFSEYAKSRDRETEALRKEVQLYRTLSTAGITAATFAHESHGNPLKVIHLSAASLRKRINRYVETEHQGKLIDPLRKIETSTESLSTLSSATLSLVAAQKRRIGKTHIHECLEKIRELMKPFLDDRDTKLEFKLAEHDPSLLASEAAIESVFINLINNSLNAFRRAGTENRKIEVTTNVYGDHCEVRFSDSGPGILDVNIRDIWLPGITTDKDGTGLGLTIVRDTVKDLGGSVSALKSGPLGGAEIIVNLSILDYQ